MSLAPSQPLHFDLDLKPTAALYFAVGLEAGAVIALQICIMRIFSVGSWAHFGSLVVSLAMLGFGLTSAVMCISKDWFDRHWRGVAMASLLLFGPLTVAANLLAQQIPFNAIFLVSDPMQKWRLAGNFMLYMLPFLAGALYLGTVFLKANKIFSRVYFADLTGAGLCGLAFLVAMYLSPPENLIVVPLLLWFIGSLFWFSALADRRGAIWITAVAAATIAAHFALPPLLGIPKLAVSDYKGVAYARKFPDAARVYESPSPFGYLEVYSSSYLHFAPGLSDNAAFSLPKMPENAYLGMYVDGEGPSGIIRDLPKEQTAYYRFLPMVYPYLMKPNPDTFVVQFGGGISTSVALQMNSKSVTVAEGNPAVLAAFRTDKGLRDFTGDVLNNPRVKVIDYDGRLYLAYTSDRYDVIDLSLADFGRAVEPGRLRHRREVLLYARGDGQLHARAQGRRRALGDALEQGRAAEIGAEALRHHGGGGARSRRGRHRQQILRRVELPLDRDRALQTRRLSRPKRSTKLREHTRAMSFDEIYYPGFEYDQSQTAKVLDDYRHQIFFEDNADPTDEPKDEPPPGTNAPAGAGEPGADKPAGNAVPATTMGQLAWHSLVHGGWDEIADQYVFDTRMLTNKRPYFAAYVKPGDLPHVTDRLELLQDEWGYLLLWATLAIACIAALSLVLIPLVFGWRTIFSHNPGKFRTIVYFACLGAGYIMVEVGLISDFMLALSNATVSASVLITGMLVFSGLGAFFSERFLDRARNIMPKMFIAIGVLLIGYGLFLDRVLDLIGTLPYALRLCLLLRADLPARIPDGLPDADRDDDAGAARQGPHVPVGLGHQRLLLRHRRRGRAHHRDLVRSQRRADDRGHRLPHRHPGILPVLLPLKRAPARATVTAPAPA